MKILIVGDGQSPNLIKSYRIDPLAKHFRDKGWEVTVISSRPKEKIKYTGYENIEFHHIPPYVSPNNWKSVVNKAVNKLHLIRKTKKIMKKEKFDVVRAISLFPAYASLGKESPVITNLGDNFQYVYKHFKLPLPFFASKILNKVQKKVLTEGDLTIINSNAQRDYFKEMPIEKSVVLPNGFYMDRFLKSPKKKFSRKKKIIFYHGDISKIDGLETLIKAVNELQKTRNDFHVLIIGDGPEKYINELKSMIKKLGLNDKFTFTGWVKHEEIGGWIKLADVCVAPFVVNESADPSVPAKTIEYLGMNRKTITTPCRGTLQFFGDIVEVMDEGNYKQMAELISKTINSKKNPNYEKYMKNFDWNSIVKYEYKIVNDFLKNPEQDFRKYDYDKYLNRK